MKSWELLLKEFSGLFTFVAGLRHLVGKDDYCPFHRHPNLEMVYHPRGKGRTSTEDRMSANFAPGEVVLYAPMRAHDQTMTEQGEDVCIHLALPPRLGSRLPSLLHVVNATARQREELEYLGARQGQRNFVGQRVDALRATALLLDLVQTASTSLQEGKRRPGMRKVQMAKDFMDDQFAVIKSLEEVALQVDLSHDRLRHLFKEETGTSLIGYLTGIRIAHAKILLENSPMPLKQVAASCGFKDEYYFSAVFRKLMKKPPGAFRFRNPDSNRGRPGS
jgi:AraC-like DNA-binding protein